MTVVFDDINTYDGKNTTYAIVNESVSTWRRVLQAMPSVDNAASICSGGEVSFFAIAPKVRKTLSLIDHSYQSMYYAIGKYHLIEKFGSVKAFEALVKNQRDVLRDAFVEGNKGLPTELPALTKEVREYLDAQAKWNEDYRKWEEAYYHQHRLGSGQGDYDEWMRKNPRPTRPLNYHPPVHRAEGFEYRWQSATQVYKDIGQKPVTEFRARRNKVAFWHGDLSDLIERGPFDFVYLSNALQYAGRNGKTYDVNSMVKPGGFIAYTGSPYGDNKEMLKRCESVVGINPRTDPGSKLSGGHGMSWTYNLVRTPA